MILVYLALILACARVRFEHVVVGLPGEDERITTIEDGGEMEPGSGHGASIVHFLQWEGIDSVGRHTRVEGYHLPMHNQRWFLRV